MHYEATRTATTCRTMICCSSRQRPSCQPLKSWQARCLPHDWSYPAFALSHRLRSPSSPAHLPPSIEPPPLLLRFTRGPTPSSSVHGFSVLIDSLVASGPRGLFVQPGVDFFDGPLTRAACLLIFVDITLPRSSIMPGLGTKRPVNRPEIEPAVPRTAKTTIGSCCLLVSWTPSYQT